MKKTMMRTTTSRRRIAEIGEDPEKQLAEEADYAKLLAEVHDDYVNGRVVEHQGWVLSQHEFDTLGPRQKDQARAAGSGAIS